MKTYFKKLNEQSKYLYINDIDKLISHNDMMNITEGFHDYIKSYASDLMPFTIINYKSQILNKLKLEKIYTRQEELSHYVKLLEDATEIEDRFMEYVNDYLFKSVSDIVNNSQFKYIDNKEKEEAINDYIYMELISNFSLSFLNKDKRTGNYVICRYNAFSEDYVNVIYHTKNEKNSFGIKDGESLSKEHLIEYEKELCGIVGYQVNIYSMWFDNI